MSDATASSQKQVFIGSELVKRATVPTGLVLSTSISFNYYCFFTDFKNNLLIQFLCCYFSSIHCSVEYMCTLHHLWLSAKTSESLYYTIWHTGPGASQNC